MHSKKILRIFGAKQAHNNTDPPPYLAAIKRCCSTYLSNVHTRPLLNVCYQKVQSQPHLQSKNIQLKSQWSTENVMFMLVMVKQERLWNLII